MKVTFSLILLVGHADAFSCRYALARRHFVPAGGLPSSRLFSDFDSAMPIAPEIVSPYERIGIQEEELAIGIDPMDVVAYVGTRDDLIERTLKDIPSFDRRTAESEVSKFLLDADALQVFIEFQKRKAEDPDFEVPAANDEEGFFSLRTFVIIYLGYVIYTTIPQLFKNWVNSKEEAGKWNGSGIPFIDQWLSETEPVNVIADAGTAAQGSISDSVQSLGDVASSVMENMSSSH